jgi:hypothetical protein
MAWSQYRIAGRCVQEGAQHLASKSGDRGRIARLRMTMQNGPDRKILSGPLHVHRPPAPQRWRSALIRRPA